MEKICFKCGENKELEEFYKHPGMFDGRLGKCKICTKNDTKTRADKLLEDPVWVEKEQERHREKYHRLGYKDIHKPTPQMKLIQMNKYRLKYPEKYKAKNYIQCIKILKGNHRHHWSYNDIHFKDVIELTIAKHNFIHRFLVYNQDSKMYYKKGTLELLDTKQKHLEYIHSLF